MSFPHHLISRNVQLTLLITATGVITGFTLTAANGNERDALWEMVQMIHG